MMLPTGLYEYYCSPMRTECGADPPRWESLGFPNTSEVAPPTCDGVSCWPIIALSAHITCQILSSFDQLIISMAVARVQCAQLSSEWRSRLQGADGRDSLAVSSQTA